MHEHKTVLARLCYVETFSVQFHHMGICVMICRNRQISEIIEINAESRRRVASANGAPESHAIASYFVPVSARYETSWSQSFDSEKKTRV